MTSRPFLPLALALLLLPAGCVVTVSEPDHYGGSHTTHHGPPHGASCADIRAASSISFDSEAADVLGQIAARNDLSAHEQTYLIDATLDALSFSSSQADVLVVLAGNPCLHPDAREHLSHRVEEISFSSDRKRVADALVQNDGGRGWPPPPAEPPPGDAR